jgi:hypothetical protein|tara:strand:+ start:275 stop:463 length:189 start_codon:yes stop_codon:yes gene_type:complete
MTQKNEKQNCSCKGKCKCARKAKLQTLSGMANDMDAWLDNLENKEQPKACDIDDEDCEACGS